jgi:PIN domain nuclease of toxin-antitoxin system
MRLLLDTHTFLWFIEGNLNLSNVARNLIEDQGNQRLLSIVSLWESVCWSEAKKHWQALIDGKYEWPSISKQLQQKGIIH